MVSHEVTAWRYFRAAAGSAPAAKLDAAEKKVTEFAADFTEFKNRHENGGEIVALVEMGAWSPEIFNLGIESPTLPTPAEAWIPTRAANVYRADPATRFHQTQSEILKRLYTLPHPNFVWMLGDGGDKENHPGLANIFREMPGDAGETDKVAGTIIDVRSAEAFRLGEDWLFAIPVNPENGKFYRPPGCEEIPAQDLPQTLGGRKIEELPAFYAVRPLGTIKTYEGVMGYFPPSVQ